MKVNFAEPPAAPASTRKVGRICAAGGTTTADVAGIAMVMEGTSVEIEPSGPPDEAAAAAAAVCASR